MVASATEMLSFYPETPNEEIDQKLQAFIIDRLIDHEGKVTFNVNEVDFNGIDIKNSQFPTFKAALVYIVNTIDIDIPYTSAPF